MALHLSGLLSTHIRRQDKTPAAIREISNETEALLIENQ